MVRAKEGTCLAELVKMAIPICQQAELTCPRTGPGRKPEIADWVLAVLIMVGVAKKKKSKSAQYRYLCEHRESLQRLLSIDRLPARSTFFDRYRRVHRLLEVALYAEGERAIARGWTDARVVAVDKSLIAARGSPWHRRNGRRVRRQRGVDDEAGWGRNEHDGWVYGYGYEVVIACGKDGVVWPLMATVEPANSSETRTFRDKLAHLPAATRYVLADRGYDADDHCEAIEWHEGRRTGRRFLCPTRRSARGPARKAWKRSRDRQKRHAHRQAREIFLRSNRGHAIYRRRKTTIEPFNSWFKSLFELEDRVWHRGLANNRTQILASLLLYQLLLRINQRRSRRHGRVKWLLDAL